MENVASPLPKCLTSNTVDCCKRKRLLCPPPPPVQISAKSGWRWQCKLCTYFTHYLHKAEKCENLHFGPTLTNDINDDDNNDNDNDDNNVNNDNDNDRWLVNGVAIRHHQPSPAIPAAAKRRLPTRPTVTSSDGNDIGENMEDNDTVKEQDLPALVVRDAINNVHSDDIMVAPAFLLEVTGNSVMAGRGILSGSRFHSKPKVSQSRRKHFA